MKYDPTTYSQNITRLEALEFEAWDDYGRAERQYLDIQGMRGYADETERAKRRMSALLRRHRAIMRDIMFLNHSHVLSHPRRMQEADGRVIIRTIEEVVSLARAESARDPEPSLEAQR